MNNALLFISIAVLASMIVGGVLMVLGLRSAPQGFEDENGFHCGPLPTSAVSTAGDDFAVCLDKKLAYASR